VQTLSDLGEPVIEIPQAVKGCCGDKEVRVCVAGAQMQDMLQVAHALFDLASLEATAGAELTQITSTR